MRDNSKASNAIYRTEKARADGNCFFHSIVSGIPSLPKSHKLYEKFRQILRQKFLEALEKVENKADINMHELEENAANEMATWLRGEMHQAVLAGRKQDGKENSRDIFLEFLRNNSGYSEEFEAEANKVLDQILVAKGQKNIVQKLNLWFENLDADTKAKAKANYPKILDQWDLKTLKNKLLEFKQEVDERHNSILYEMLKDDLTLSLDQETKLFQAFIASIKTPGFWIDTEDVKYFASHFAVKIQIHIDGADNEAILEANTYGKGPTISIQHNGSDHYDPKLEEEQKKAYKDFIASKGHTIFTRISDTLATTLEASYNQVTQHKAKAFYAGLLAATCFAGGGALAAFSLGGVYAFSVVKYQTNKLATELENAAYQENNTFSYVWCKLQHFVGANVIKPVGSLVGNVGMAGSIAAPAAFLLSTFLIGGMVPFILPTIGVTAITGGLTVTIFQNDATKNITASQDHSHPGLENNVRKR